LSCERRAVLEVKLAFMAVGLALGLVVAGFLFLHAKDKNK
jgi:hypothetical protein